MPPTSIDYEEPSEASLIADLALVVGHDSARSLVDIACRQLRVSRPVESIDNLVAITEALMEFGAEIRVAARAAKVRTVTHRAIGRAALRRI